MARALFTKCVGPKEVGKIFSAVAIVAAIGPVIGDPVIPICLPIFFASRRRSKIVGSYHLI